MPAPDRMSFGRMSFGRFARRNLHSLLLLGSGLLLLVAAQTLVLHGYWLGLAHGLLVGGFAGLVGLGFVVGSGITFRVSPSWGEDDTRQVLRAAKQRGHIFGWVDDLPVVGGGVDHLVVTPQGIYALDSTWRSPGIAPVTIQRDLAAASSAARRAEVALREVRRPARVTPVVVVWGADESLGDAIGVHGGVRFVSGRNLKAWLVSHRHGEASVDRVSAEATLAQLKRFARQSRRDGG